MNKTFLVFLLLLLLAIILGVRIGESGGAKITKPAPPTNLRIVEIKK